MEAYIGSLLKEKINIPLVVTEHSSKMNKEIIDPQLYNIADSAYSNADEIIAVSPFLKNNIDRNFQVNSIYIPNTVDLEIFKYKSMKETSVFNFISVGNLIDTKRMDLLIIAFGEAFSGNSKVKLTIYGTGPNHKSLDDLIKSLDLESQIQIMGLRSRAEISDKLAKSDCFVLPSESETFGVVYIEALAMGVPVIATKCGGPEIYVNKDNGILIDVNNKEQLIKSMEYMHKNISSYNSKDISLYIEKQFSHKTVANKIIKVYENVINKSIINHHI